MINYRKKTSYFDVYRDVLIPFVSIVSFFWICLWKSESLSWDSRMFLALLGAGLSFKLERALSILNLSRHSLDLK